MLSTKVHKARQLASHALPLTRRILSLGKGLLHKVTGLAGRLLGAVGRCVRQVTDYLLESKAVRLLLKLTMIVSAVATVLSADTVSALVRSSRFESRTPVPEDLSSAHLVTLSTCSYEFEDARFVVVGVLTPIDPVAAPAGSGE